MPAFSIDYVWSLSGLYVLRLATNAVQSLCHTACIMAFLLLIILMLLVPLFRSTQATDTARRQEYYRPCPLPKCDTCPSVEDLRAPGIGLALDTAYG
jgi:hypothetical protein